MDFKLGRNSTFYFKYVALIAIFCLLFSLSSTLARYSTYNTDDLNTDIDSFDVIVKLYDQDGMEVENLANDTISLDGDSLNYSSKYYLYIQNNDRYTLFYKVDVGDAAYFYLAVEAEKSEYYQYSDHQIVGYLDHDGGDVSSIYIPIEISFYDEMLPYIDITESPKLSLSIDIEYQHTEAYELDYHTSGRWFEVTNENFSQTVFSDNSSYTNFYLGEDFDYVAYDINYYAYIYSDVVFDLNGHTLSSNCWGFFDIESGSNLTLMDSQGTGEFLVTIYGIVVNGGTFTMDSGHISNNPNYSQNSLCRGIVCNSGEAIINGGLIDGFGYGILALGDSIVTLNGGTITGNWYGVSTDSDSLVYGICTASINLSGSPKIYDNVYSDGTTYNVYLQSTHASIKLVGPLEEDAYIGVTLPSETTQITSSDTTSYYYESSVKYFHSDNSNYKVSIDHDSHSLKLIDKNSVNISVGVYINYASKSNLPTLYTDGFDWIDEGSDTLQRELQFYNGSYKSDTQSTDISSLYFQLFYQFGVQSIGNNYTFGISPLDDVSYLKKLGFGPTDKLSSSLTKSVDNFLISGTQSVYDKDNQEYTAEVLWSLDFSESDMQDILKEVGDLIIVLYIDSYTYISSTTPYVVEPGNQSEDPTNNIVENVYFIVDGQYQESVNS